MSYFYDKTSHQFNLGNGTIDIYKSQKGMAIVSEAVPSYITIVGDVKTDQVSLAAALAALE